MPVSAINGVVCCGNLAFDIPTWPVENFRWGTTTFVDRITQNPGGNGGNTSFTLASLGVPVRLVSCTGIDPQADSLRAQLASAGVDLSTVHAVPDRPTNTVVCLVHPSGDRMFFHQPGASAAISPGMLEFDPARHSHFHFANPFTLPLLRHHAAGVFERARTAGLTTSLDTGWDAAGRWLADIEPALPFVDLLFLNDSEARHLASVHDPIEGARRLKSLAGIRDVVLKLGGAGCQVFPATQPEFNVPAFPVERVIDTTGAGDCFAGAFLAALHRGWDYPRAARLANAVGALNVSSLGAIAGIRNWDSTIEWMNDER